MPPVQKLWRIRCGWKQMNQLKDSVEKKCILKDKAAFLCEGDWQWWHIKAKLLIYLQSLSST